MSYYRVCPLCGAALDPGEQCDCRNEKESAASATNTDGGGVETGMQTHISTSSLSDNKEENQV